MEESEFLTCAWDWEFCKRIGFAVAFGYSDGEPCTRDNASRIGHGLLNLQESIAGAAHFADCVGMRGKILTEYGCALLKHL